MKKSILFISVLLVFFLWVDCWAEEGKGQVGIATDIEDALIYVNGKKKASAGDGYTTIRLKEGDYTIKANGSIRELKIFLSERTLPLK